MSDAYAVGIVVDPAYGERLVGIGSRIHVWAVDTPENAVVARRMAALDPKCGIERGVTLFSIEDAEDREGNVAGELETIELHHGIHSHKPPISLLEVVGVSLRSSLRGAFEALGYSLFQETPEGFHAAKPNGG